MTFARAVADLEFYREAVTHPVGRVLGYVVLLVLVVSGLGLVSAYPGMRDLGTGLSQTVDAMPRFTLRGGRLEVEGGRPVVLAESSRFLVVIDTTGQVAEDVLDTIPAGVWVGEHKLVLKGQTLYTTIRFSSLGRTTFDRDRLQSLVGWYPALALGLLAAFLVIAIILKLAGTLSLTVAGLVLSMVMGGGLRFGSVWRVSAYAVTAPTLLLGMAGVASISIPRPFFVYWIIAIVYVWTALRRLTPGPAK